MNNHECGHKFPNIFCTFGAGFPCEHVDGHCEHCANTCECEEKK